MAKYLLVITDLDDGGLQIKSKIDPNPRLDKEPTNAQKIGINIKNYIDDLLGEYRDYEKEDEIREERSKKDGC